MVLPNAIKYGTVTWTALSAVIDDLFDNDRNPNAAPIPNVIVTFTASTPRVVVQDPAPVTVFLQSITARTNESGVLVGPDGVEGIKLVATDNLLASPVNFTYRVNISGIGVPITLDVAIPSDAIIDLSHLVPISTSAGKVLPPVRGEKGEPGGWTLPVIVYSTVDANTLTAPGTYFQTSGSTTALNWPVAGVKGNLTVTGAPGSIHQEFATFTSVSNLASKVLYVRDQITATTWSAWTTYAAQRVDNTAGKAIYTWDEKANREQLIYGDTGWRSFPLNEGVTGKILIRRIGEQVTFRFIDVIPNGSIRNLAIGPTTGFIPADGGVKANNFVLGFMVVGGDPLQDWHRVDIYRYGIQWQGPLRSGNNVALTSGISGYVSYVTDDAWPTTLPGTPV